MAGQQVSKSAARLAFFAVSLVLVGVLFACSGNPESAAGGEWASSTEELGFQRGQRKNADVCFTASASAPESAWSVGAKYRRGDLVSFNGDTYEALKSHRASNRSTPEGAVHFWRKPTPCGVTEWEEQTAYRRGSIVVLDNVIYEAQKSHLSSLLNQPGSTHRSRHSHHHDAKNWKKVASCDVTAVGECDSETSTEAVFTQSFHSSISCDGVVLDFSTTTIANLGGPPGGAETTVQQGALLTWGGASVVKQNTNSAAGLLQMDVEYGEPVNGLERAVFTSDGQLLQGSLDGRDIVPFAVSAPPATLEFEDGQPAPRVNLEPVLAAAFFILSKKADAEHTALCSGRADAPGVITAGLSDADFAACSSCGDSCSKIASICVAGPCAAAVASFFLPFLTPVTVPVCVAATVSCTAAFAICGMHCSDPGEACCPTACSTRCCGSQEVCAEGNTCCLAQRFCPESNECCSVGQECTGQGCCVLGRDCGSVCCDSGELCLSGSCCPVEQHCAGACCGPGEVCEAAECVPEPPAEPEPAPEPDADPGPRLFLGGTVPQTDAGPTVCIKAFGGFFEPLGTVSLQYVGIPRRGPITTSVVADAAGNINVHDTLIEMGTSALLDCTDDERQGDVDVLVTDVVRGTTALKTLVAAAWCFPTLQQSIGDPGTCD